MNPTISIVNESETANTAELKLVLPALQIQITRDFERIWGWGATLKLNAKKFDMKLVIRDHAHGDDLGYHIENGKPIAYVYAKDAKDAEGEYSSTLSHELLEMIADPNVNLYGAGKLRVNGKHHVGFYAFEVCDPVQENYYKIDGVRVQDFVRPEWFEEDHEPGAMKMNFMKTLDAPFTLALGGYAEVFAKGRWHSLTGPKARPKRRRHRLQMRMSLLK